MSKPNRVVRWLGLVINRTHCVSLSCIVHCVCVGVLTLGDVVGSRSSMGTAAAIKLNQSQTSD